MQARSQQSNAIWLSFRGNMASDQTVSQKQGRGSISGTSMRTETRVHALTHAQRHWLKMWTHCDRDLCCIMCCSQSNETKPRPQKCSLCPKDPEFNNRHTGCEISEPILSFLTSEHIPSPQKVRPELCQRQ